MYCLQNSSVSSSIFLVWTLLRSPILLGLLFIYLSGVVFAAPAESFYDREQDDSSEYSY